MQSSLTGWQPPANYQPIPSAVDNITVFAPRPAEEKEPNKPTTFKCPQCGATTAYDVTAGGVACEHCGYVSEAKTANVGRAAEEFEFTLETLTAEAEAAHGWGVERKELHCDACGATIALAEGALTATCPFCASNKVAVRAASGDQLRPRVLIPFKIKPDDLRARVTQWLGQGWYHPEGLAAAAGVQHFTGIYLPFWTFDARMDTGWKAEIGYERQESYYDSDDKEWKTRTVVDWRWETGSVTVPIDDWLVPGTLKVSNFILQKLYPFQMSELVGYAPDYLAGWQAQTYDVNLPQAWETGKTAMREHARQAAQQNAKSRTGHVRNFGMTADFANESWRYILLPVYIAAYKFESKVFQVMVNGQSGGVAGQKPVAWWKIWLAVAGLLVPGLCGTLAGLPLLLAGPVGLVVLGIAVVLLVGGGAASWYLYNNARSSEAA